MTEAEIFEWAKNNDDIVAFTGVKKIGTIDEADIYTRDYVTDEDGNGPYTGLPSLIVVKGDDINEVSGEEALELLMELKNSYNKKSPRGRNGH